MHSTEVVEKLHLATTPPRDLLTDMVGRALSATTRVAGFSSFAERVLGELLFRLLFLLSTLLRLLPTLLAPLPSTRGC